MFPSTPNIANHVSNPGGFVHARSFSLAPLQSDRVGRPGGHLQGEEDLQRARPSERIQPVSWRLPASCDLESTARKTAPSQGAREGAAENFHRWLQWQCATMWLCKKNEKTMKKKKTLPSAGTLTRWRAEVQDEAPIAPVLRHVSPFLTVSASKDNHHFQDCDGFSSRQQVFASVLLPV